MIPASFLDLHGGSYTIPPIAKQLASLLRRLNRSFRHHWFIVCTACGAGSSMRAMDKPSAKNPSDSERKSEAERRLREWARSFVPTETSIDGGLFPPTLGHGMLGFENYDDLKLAGEEAELPEIDEATKARLERLFGGPIRPKERLKKR